LRPRLRIAAAASAAAAACACCSCRSKSSSASDQQSSSSTSTSSSRWQAEACVRQYSDGSKERSCSWRRHQLSKTAAAKQFAALAATDTC
jgi:hypothetical protein